MELILSLLFLKTNQIKPALYLNYASVLQQLFIFPVWNHWGILRNHEWLEVPGRHMSSETF